MRNYTNNKLPFSFNNMLDTVPDSHRRCRNDEYNFILPSINVANLHHFPTPKLVYNWNSLPITLKSVSEQSLFRTELKKHFTSMYETNCTKQKCYSCKLETKKYFITPGHPVSCICKLNLGYFK